MEMLLVVSLISLLTFALFRALSNGIKLWQRSQSYVIEEDIVLLFEKMHRDINNMVKYSRIPLKGDEHHFEFPAIIQVSADPESSFQADQRVDQVGKVEYAYDFLDRGVYRREANYSQALKENFGPKRFLVSKIKGMNFRYYYLTEHEQIYSDHLLEVIPFGIEVTVRFEDTYGERSMSKFIEVSIDG